MGRVDPSALDGRVPQMSQPASQMAQPADVEISTQSHNQINDSLPHNYAIGSKSENTVGTTDNLNLVDGRPWSTGLYDCNLHPLSAVMTLFFPCVTFGQIVEILDGGEMSCPLAGYIYLLMMPSLCTHWIMGSKYRKKLRERYDLVEAPMDDRFAHIFCPFCALSQEYRELKMRGLDPALGWKGVLALAQKQQGSQHQNQVQLSPTNQAMYR